MKKQSDEAEALRQGVQLLGKLAAEEYHSTSLDELLGELPTEKGKLRFMRLLGVMLKEPFAESVATEPSEATGAYRAWQWRPDKILAEQADAEWQYQTLQGIYKDRRGQPADEKPVPAADLRQFLECEGVFEKRLSLHLLDAMQKHLCGNAEAVKAVEEALAKAKLQGGSLVNPMPASVIPGVGVGVCALVATSLPHAALLGPIAGGVTVLILNIGLSGFCSWVKEKAEALHVTEDKEQHVS